MKEHLYVSVICIVDIILFSLFFFVVDEILFKLSLTLFVGLGYIEYVINWSLPYLFNHIANMLLICDIVAFVMALMKTGGGGPNPARSQC